MARGVDESRKDKADRVARYQTDYVGRTCLCHSYHTAAAASKMLSLCFSFAVLSFSLGRCLLFRVVRCIVSNCLVTSPGGHDTSFLISNFTLLFYWFILSLSFFSVNESGLLAFARLRVLVLGRVACWAFSVLFLG